MGVIASEDNKIDAATRHKLKSFVKKLEQYRGRGTELVSVYVPAGYSLDMIINQLQQEQGTAENIKSKATKTNVIDALERMIQHLKVTGTTPPNGLAVFSGNISEQEGRQDVQVWSVEMPVPSSQRLYRCDKEFILHPLREIVDHENIYGLVVLDRRDGMIGLLKGKKIVPIVQTHSEVPGKHKSGGQCLVQDTCVQVSTGDIIPIGLTHNPLSVTSYSDKRIAQSPILDKWETKKDVVYRIITDSPRVVIESSKDHIFFTRGMKEKPAEELKIGDFLVMPERLKVRGSPQKLQKKDFTAYSVIKQGLCEITSRRKSLDLSQKQLASETQLGQSTISAFERGKINLSEIILRRVLKALKLEFHEFSTNLVKRREIKLPEIVTPRLAKVIGYYLGDGCSESDRLTFFEQREEVAEYYAKLMKNLFGVNVVLKFRADKRYYQIRVYGQPIVKFVKDNFPELKNSIDSSIPKKILESPLPVVGAFLRGIYDAEGYISRGRVGIGMNNKKVVKSLQMVLLRFGIISSFLEYDNRKNPYSSKTRYSIDICDKQSLELFGRFIGFTAEEKATKLAQAIRKKDGRNRMRQVFLTGKEVRQIVEDSGYNLEIFPKVNNFFRNEREMSKDAFRKSVLEYVENHKLRKKLLDVLNIPLLPVKIKEITKIERTTDMADIAVGNQNFVANCLLVHNSAARFERLREGATVEHFKKIAEYMKDQFLPMGNELRGIIIGGPDVTVNKFLGHDYITGDVKKKIIGNKPLSYTGEFGMQELLEKSEDLLAAEEVAKEKAIMQKFFHELSTDSGLAAYGKTDVLKCIKYGAVETVLLSEDLDDNVIEEYEAEADQMGSSTELISTSTREGVQLKEMGKVAAILRYRIE